MPSRPENDPHIIFLAQDTISVHTPHNDPLLVELGIRKFEVTKVLINTGNSINLIFRDTLDKMEINLQDMKPSTRSLTGFNGVVEEMVGTIRLQSMSAALLVPSNSMSSNPKSCTTRSLKYPGST
ncbi:hypothetical protein N665_0038s0026 [Sinapis alba]|nr:hypothetical protein N665_0038s0026 [Sinapis alba]